MKQCIKYLMTILFSILLYDGMVQVASMSCTLRRNESERCTLSQTPALQLSHTHIRNIYHYFLSTPLYIDKVDTMQVRDNKSMYLLLSYLRTGKAAHSSGDVSLSPPAYRSASDPLSYYVFGLRKIII